MRNNVKLYILIALTVTLIGGILGYTYNRTQDIIHGPRIEISSPKNGTTLDKSLVRIVGIARNITAITLNDRKIYVDEFGAIQEDVLLTYGYNILTIKARDKYGRETVKTLELVYK